MRLQYLSAGFLLLFIGCSDDSNNTSSSTSSTTGTSAGGSGEAGATTTVTASTGTGIGDPSDMYPAPHPTAPQVVTFGGPVLANPKIVPIVFSSDTMTM